MQAVFKNEKLRELSIFISIDRYDRITINFIEKDNVLELSVIVFYVIYLLYAIFLIFIQF